MPAEDKNASAGFFDVALRMRAKKRFRALLIAYPEAPFLAADLKRICSHWISPYEQGIWLNTHMQEEPSFLSYTRVEKREGLLLS